MLTAVHIEKYLSCENVTIADMSHFMALVGRNGAGKTNVLKAIEWAAKTATGEKAIELTELNNVTLEFECNGVFYKYSARIDEQDHKKENESSHLLIRVFEEKFSKRDSTKLEWTEVVRKWDGVVEIVSDGKRVLTKALTPSLTALSSLLADHPDLKDINQALTFLKGIRYYPLDEPNFDRKGFKYIPRSDFDNWVKEFTSTGFYNDTVQAKLLYLYLSKRDEFDALQSLLGANGLGIIEQIEIDHFNGPSLDDGNNEITYYLRFKPSNLRSKWLGLNQLSLGTRRVLRILTTMFFDDSSVFLFEQPEDAIHDQLLRKLANLIRVHSDPAQFILATHSSMVLCEFKPEQIRIVEMKNGSTAVRSLTPQEVVVANRYVKETGPLSDFIESIEEN